MNSLQGRLSLGLALSLIALFAVQWLIVGASQRALMENYVLTRLEHDAESLLGGLEFAGPATISLNPSRVAGIFQQPFSGHYYLVGTGETVLRSRSLWDETLEVNPAAPGEIRIERVTGPQGEPLLVRVAGYEKQGVAVTVATAEALSHIDQDIRRFQWRHTLVFLFVLGVLLLVQRFIVRLSLRPVEQAREDVRRLDRGEVTHLPENVPRELQPLVREINSLLDALERRLRRSRHALGNLAHAMKTPLSLLRQSSESPALRAHPELRAELAAQVEALRAIVDRELKRARLAGAGGARMRLVPAREIPPLLDALRTIYRDKPLAFSCSIPEDLVLAMDREDFLELAGNLIDNACKWTRGQVRIDVSAGEITVEDDGPGVAESDLDRLERRGVRADETAPGHGLGLAIVRDIVDSYDAELSFGRSLELGGFQARVRLPSV